LNLHNFAPILLSGNKSLHINEDIKQMLAEWNIRFIPFPPHTSHSFQRRERLTFAAFTRASREIHIDRGAGSSVWHVTELMKALERATDSTNDRAGFQFARLEMNPEVFAPVA
jgi:hypothetical protein